MKSIYLIALSFLLFLAVGCAQKPVSTGSREIQIEEPPVVSASTEVAENTNTTNASGEKGDKGDKGDAGEKGEGGKSLTCRDIIGNNDVNKDGVVDNKDCQKYITSDCKEGATDCIPCTKDSSGKCVETSNEPPCKATNTCDSKIIADVCSGGEFKAPESCPSSCALWRFEMGGDEECIAEDANNKKVDVLKIIEKLGWNTKLTETEQLAKIEEGGVTEANIKTCKADCETNYCVPIKLEAKDKCPDGGFKIPSYYKKMHFSVTTCLQRWHVMQIGSTYLSPWTTLTGVLKSNNGREIAIKDYYTAADSHYCASLYKDDKGNSYYNSADVKIKYEKAEDEAYDWDFPGYNSFEFYDQFEYVPDFSEPYYVIPTNFKGPGLFIFKTTDTNKKNGQQKFFIENIFWWDPVVTVEFDFWYKPST